MNLIPVAFFFSLPSFPLLYILYILLLFMLTTHNKLLLLLSSQLFFYMLLKGDHLHLPTYLLFPALFLFENSSIYLGSFSFCLKNFHTICSIGLMGFVWKSIFGNMVAGYIILRWQIFLVFQHFKDGLLLSSGLHHFWQEVCGHLLFLYIMSLFLTAFKIFSLSLYHWWGPQLLLTP